jgi:hypothetical protein
MMNTNEQQATPPQPTHQIVADGEIIYEGDNWQQAFLDASQNPAYGTITHLENGEPGATFGPPAYKPQ